MRVILFSIVPVFGWRSFLLSERLWNGQSRRLRQVAPKFCALAVVRLALGPSVVVPSGRGGEVMLSSGLE